MKKVITLLLTVLFILASCNPASGQTDTTAVPESTGIITASDETEALTDTAETSVVATEPVTTEPEATVFERGILTASLNNEDALREVILSDAFSVADSVELIITSAFSLTDDIILNRPLTLTYNARMKSDGHTIGIVTRNPGEIIIRENGVGCFDFSDFYINSPYCALTVGSKADTPSASDVFLRHNIQSYNGNAAIYGGGLSHTLTSVTLTGCSGTVWSADGNVITLLAPYSADDKSISSAKVSAVTDAEYTSDGKILTLTNGTESYSYLLDIRRMKYDIPVIYINTESEITSKDDYVHGSMKIDASTAAGLAECGVYSGGISIRGRGNASWRFFPKKSYRIKLDEGAELLGMNKDKDWVLISAYPDKSLIRNTVAHAMASTLDKLTYTPSLVLVDVFLNGSYIGVYTFGEKIEFGNGKLEYTAETDVNDTSYLFEVGWDFNDNMVSYYTYFDVDHIERIVIKEPDMSARYSKQAMFISDYFRKADASVVSLNGYEDYIDIDSLIDYMIITELTNNTEAAFYRSCFMYKPAGGKITFGPVWDFDMAFGNHNIDNNSYDTWCTAKQPDPDDALNTSTWITYLLEDKSFTERLRNRWNEKKEELMNTASSEILKQAALAGASQAENFRVWNIMNKRVGEGYVDHKKYNTFDLQVEYIKSFLQMRYEWIDTELNGQ